MHMATTLKDYAGTLDLKGILVLRATRNHCESILCQLKLEFVHILIRRDLLALLRRLSDIETDHRMSFYRADLVLQAVDDDGATHYVAAEASYTADRQDTDRALRNAEFLQRCTGCPAHAVISSVNNDHEVQRLVQWYRPLVSADRRGLGDRMARQLPPAGFASHTATTLRVALTKWSSGNGWFKANAPTPIRRGCQIEANRHGGSHVQATSHRMCPPPPMAWKDAWAY